MTCPKATGVDLLSRAMRHAVVGTAFLVLTACGAGDPTVSAGDQPTMSAPSRPTTRPSLDTAREARPSVSASTRAGQESATSQDKSLQQDRPKRPKRPGEEGASPGPTSNDVPAKRSSRPSFPVPVEVGDARQLITVDASGSYAQVTAWGKTGKRWRKEFSTSGRVGAKGVVNGTVRRQGTSTTPGGTYTITEGFGLAPAATAMPYHRVGSQDWWVQDPKSKFYNSLHSAQGADFPLTESGERGSERLANYPVQYAKALVIDFNRWPAVPGRGAGIFLHVNGRGATAGCVSVPRALMDRVMTWIRPEHHPRIAIG